MLKQNKLRVVESYDNTLQQLIKKIQKQKLDLKITMFDQFTEECKTTLQTNILILDPPNHIVKHDINDKFILKLQNKKRIQLQSFLKEILNVVGLKDYKFLFKSTDIQNRKSIPKTTSINHINKEIKILFDRKDILKTFKKYINSDFQYYSDFQDAIVPNKNMLFHSFMSFYLNTGRIFPSDVVKIVMNSKASDRNKENFIRQVVGWRIFAQLYQKAIIVQNDIRITFKKNKRKLNRDIWINFNKPSGIDYVDDMLQLVQTTGFLNHIQRLYLLSFMVQLFTDPNEIYQWFLCYFIDATEWVMGLNVYGMIFDDRFVQKTYLFSSQYIQKQSGNRYKRQPIYDQVDDVYRYFIQVYQDNLHYIPKTREANIQNAKKLIDKLTFL